MSWLILVILAVLAVLVVAGPVLEELIDRIWPPTRHGAARGTSHPGR